MDLSDIDEIAFDLDHESDKSRFLELILLIQNRKKGKIKLLTMLIFWNINGTNRTGLDPQVTMRKQEEKLKKKQLEQQNKVIVAS